MRRKIILIVIVTVLTLIAFISRVTTKEIYWEERPSITIQDTVYLYQDNLAQLPLACELLGCVTNDRPASGQSYQGENVQEGAKIYYDSEEPRFLYLEANVVEEMPYERYRRYEEH